MLTVCVQLLPLTFFTIIYGFGHLYIMYGIKSLSNTRSHSILVFLIFLQQMKIIRLDFKFSLNSYRALFSLLAKILHIPDIVKLLLLKLAFKTFHNLQVVAVISKLLNKPQHNYFTRNFACTFYVQHCRLKIFHNSTILKCIFIME